MKINGVEHFILIASTNYVQLITMVITLLADQLKAWILITLKITKIQITFLFKFGINPNPARTKSDERLPPVLDKVSLQIHAVWSDSILLADQLPSSHLDIPKTVNGEFQKWKIDYSIFEIQQVKGHHRIKQFKDTYLLTLTIKV